MKNIYNNSLTYPLLSSTSILLLKMIKIGKKLKLLCPVNQKVMITVKFYIKYIMYVHIFILT
jgi:hypothetical protein